MSSIHDRRDIEIAVRRLLVDEWNPNNTEGIAPAERQPDTEPNVFIHTGTPGDTVLDPQIVVEAAGETPRNARGYYAAKADGSGFVGMADGTVDIRCVAGNEDATGGLTPRALATTFADEVKEIIKANPEIVNPDTLDLEYRSFSPGQRRGPLLDDTESVESRWYAVQEGSYTLADGPPSR